MLRITADGHLSDCMYGHRLTKGGQEGAMIAACCCQGAQAPQKVVENRPLAYLQQRCHVTTPAAVTGGLDSLPLLCTSAGALCKAPRADLVIQCGMWLLLAE